jgi:putative copper resistance protein D
MDLIGTGYGRLLMFKIGLFLAMLGLAAVNRLWISPALTTGNQAVWLARLKRHVLAEQVLAALVLLAVAVLGTLDPGA